MERVAAERAAAQAKAAVERSEGLPFRGFVGVIFAGGLVNLLRDQRANRRAAPGGHKAGPLDGLHRQANRQVLCCGHPRIIAVARIYVQQEHGCRSPGTQRSLNRPHIPTGQNVYVTQVGARIWLVTFVHYDLGYFDDETCRLEPIDNPFGPRVLPMSPE